MSRQDNFGDASGPQSPGAPAPGQPQRGPQQYQFSPDELRVLRDCNRDSFFQRCLPIGTMLGVATYYGVQSGHLKPSPRWGAAPKVMVASILGYFIGKMSYQSKCAEKLMQLPDSRLGALLRQRKRGHGFQESLEPGYGAGMALSPFSGISPSDTYTDVESSSLPAARNSLDDIDTTRPEQRELDDNLRPSLDNNPVLEEETMPPVQNKTTSYEELRKQNREDHQKYRTATYRGVQTPTDVPPVVRRPSSSESSSQQPTTEGTFPSKPQSRRTNIYGDVME